jgi:DNA replication protein DnaC
MIHPTIEKLHAMRLTPMADAFRAQLADPTIAELGFEERFALLVDVQQAALRDQALQQRLRRAGMRQTACLENLDLRTPRGLDRGVLQALATGTWIRQHLNVLILGPAGVGKTWISCALGNQAARDGTSVLYKRLSRLLDDLATARLAGRQARALTTIARTKLLILDDWAMIKLTAEQRRDLMEVIDDRHGRASTIIATQVPLDRWHDMIGDPTYADAILDRLVHNAHRIELRGESMRRRATKPELIHTTEPEKDQSNK